MSRPRWLVPALLVVFIGLPVLEVLILVKVGDLIGLWPTIGLLVLTAVLGTWLMRREGTKAWRALIDAFGSGKVPSRELSDGALVLAGGLLLTLPGFTTDVVGLVCLLPFTRAIPRRLLTAMAEHQVESLGLGSGMLPGAMGGRGGRGRGGDVIPGEVVEPDPAPGSASTTKKTPDGPPRAIEGSVID
ncbi:FxsA family protein [Aestuariimicrobium sp. T2.26MG-19.2B]|uniref:FxsA family protein n=1 Tax=Aestuariimicrobium sp. T2.26MG-19.2B TaxID=3040679 RepID=UPI0024776CBF|nr:FxsA family protein [Aestuariimicrobium sp. T2.26MG-19.2B]CAI9409550.1 hypothetical protein AESSP_02257 [Aestuariimicrobium sp. T2.26MG-19.2B]